MPLIAAFSNLTVKISDRINGLVSKSTYDVVERRSHDEKNGHPVIKRRRVARGNESPGDNPQAGDDRSTTRTPGSEKLIWIGESALLDRLKRVNLLINGIKSISSGAACETEEHARRADHIFARDRHHREDDVKDANAFLKTVDTSINVLETVYSSTFFKSLQDRFPDPAEQIDYGLRRRDVEDISSTMAFVATMTKELSRVHGDVTIMEDAISSVIADMQAIEKNKPIPSFVRSGSVLRNALESVFPGLARSSNNDVPHITPDSRGRELTMESEGGSKSARGEESDTGRSSSSPTNRTATTAAVPSVVTGLLSSFKTPGTDFVRNFFRAGPEKTGRRLPTGRMSNLKRDFHRSILRNSRQAGFRPKHLQQSRGMMPVRFNRSMLGNQSTGAAPQRRLGKFSFNQTDGPLEEDERSGQTTSTTRDDSYTCQTSRRGDGDETVPSAGLTKTKSEAEQQSSLSKYSALKIRLEGLSISGSGALLSPPRGLSPPLSPLQRLEISEEKSEELGNWQAELQVKLDEANAKRRKEREEREKREAEERARKAGGLRPPKQLFISDLSPEWECKATQTLHQPYDKVLVTTKDGGSLGRDDFAKVVPATEWLNDNIVNGSLAWLDDYINKMAGVQDVKKQTRKCFAMSSFFYKQLREKGVMGTERMLRRNGVEKKNFLDIDTVLIPACEGNHWTLIVIRPSKRTVSHMDSLNPRGSPQKLDVAMEWIKTILQDKFEAHKWKVTDHKAPLQTNGHDCGVHTITNGLCLALGLNPMEAYGAEDMPLQRLRIAAMLLNGGFTGDFDLGGF